MKLLFSFFFRFMIVAPIGTAFAFAASPSAIGLSDGETFTYRLSWGVFGRAGDITVSAQEIQENDSTQMRIRTETATHGIVRALYPFDGQADMFYDAVSGKFVRATQQTKSRGKETNAAIVFDYDSAQATYTDYIRADRSLQVAFPEHTPADFITTLIQTRSWDLKLGESRRVSVLFDDEFYELTITAEKEQVINTKWGKKTVLVLVPRMVGEPKGMFKRGGEVRVWVSQDKDHLPLKFEVQVAVGTAKAYLTSYETSNPVAAESAVARPEI